MNIDKSLFSPEAQVLIDFLQSSDWPEAAPEFLICKDTEEDKTERSEGIVNYIAENFTNKKFCDFGCGEGHVAREVGKIAGYSIGYDVLKDGTLPWESTQNNYLLTTDFEKIKQNGPYDIILLYDVLDHVSSPEDVLKQVASISNANTKIFVRFHPWIGRHGGHLYKDLNKAWAHLVFTEEELKLMGITLQNVNKCFHPLLEQKKLFASTGFKIINSDTIKSTVEKFFRRPKIMKRLPLNKFKFEFPEWQMSQSFNDYVVQLDVPAPVETAPAPVETAPAPVETAPAPVETAPAPVNPS
jgi:2-polyprenyl-3-methyl-5-hydroxy-6-metoxy-1,4-benzoquinol methylase